MAQTFAALYENFDIAQDAVQTLIDMGFQPGTISVIGANEDDTGDMKAAEGVTFGMVVGALVGAGAIVIPGIGPVIAVGPIVAALIGGGVGAVAGAVTGGLVASLVKTGIDEQTAGKYAEAIRRGYTLVVVQTTEKMAQHAESTLRRYRPIDIDLKASEWFMSDGSVVDTTPPPAAEMSPPAATSSSTTMYDRDASVRRYETQTPASSPTLHTDEAFYEANDMADETPPMIAVVDEVVVLPTTHAEARAMPETARSKGSAMEEDSRSYNDYRDIFHSHLNTNYSLVGRGYSYYEPAYRFGYSQATNPKYENSEWYQLEAGFRSRWEEQNPGTWLDYKEAVRYAWNVIRGLG
jgi:hypothetical protein